MRLGTPEQATLVRGAIQTGSTEELATIFHMPDMSVMAPSFTRVAAKRATAPSNLPILEE